VNYCVFLSVILCCLYGYAQQNPFRSPSPVPDTIRNQSHISPQRPSVQGKKIVWKYLPFSRTLVLLQRDLSAKLSHRLRKIKERPNPAAIAGLLILAFLYGIIHSLGPGHAKALFVSHGLTRATPLRSTWVAGAVFSFTHTGSSMMLFFVVRTALGGGLAESEMYSAHFTALGGILIMVAGGVIIFSSMIEQAAQSIAGRLLRGSSSLPTIAVMAGIAPCPGAFLILSFSSIVGIISIGIAAVIAVSIGMAIIVSIAGTVGSTVGKIIVRQDNRTVWHTFIKVIRCLGGVLILAIGAVMAFG
jgi:nickel/cobalt exporter